MSGSDRMQRLSFKVLCASLIVVTVVFGVEVKFARSMYYAIACVQFLVICIAAWVLGAREIRRAAEGRRLAAAGALLVTPWALFSFLPGIGPPGGETHEENQLRYFVLLLNTIAVGGGLVVLRELLLEAGERFYSTLGFAAIVFATPLYLVWGVILLDYHRAAQHFDRDSAPAHVISMLNLSDILLFFGGALTYLANASIAASLGQAQWLGRKSSRAFIAASLFALLCLAVRGLTFPNPEEPMPWYTVPGYVVGIPAVPWIMLCWCGVVLLKRADASKSGPMRTGNGPETRIE